MGKNVNSIRILANTEIEQFNSFIVRSGDDSLIIKAQTCDTIRMTLQRLQFITGIIPDLYCTIIGTAADSPRVHLQTALNARLDKKLVNGRRRTFILL